MMNRNSVRWRNIHGIDGLPMRETHTYIKALITGNELNPWLRDLILVDKYSVGALSMQPKIAFVPTWIKKYLGDELWRKHFVSLGLVNSYDIRGIAVPYEEWAQLHIWERKRWETNEK